MSNRLLSMLFFLSAGVAFLLHMGISMSFCLPPLI